MKYENEVTVEVMCSLEELKLILEKNNFKLVEEYDVKDIYMINKEIKSDDSRELLKNCILIRNIIEEDKNTKKITYKYKEYDENNEIIKQGKLDCNVESVESAQKLLEVMNYEELIRINDHLLIYMNEEDELAVQLVNDKHIYIEVEEFSDRLNKQYSSLEEMKNVFSKYNISIKSNDYFVKKAEIEIEEKLNQN